jgi:hypothetical protein
MRKIYRLCSHQFWRIGIWSIVVCIALLIFQLAGLKRQLVGMMNIRLEQLLQGAGYSTMFFIAFSLLLIIIAGSVYQKYFGAKSIYTIMSLPVSKVGIYCSFLIPGLIAILMLCFTQVISVYLGYEMASDKYIYMKSILSADSSMVYEYMDNAVFLSFVRYGFLRIFLPLSWLDLARSVCLLAAPVITVLFFAFCERSRKYGRMGFILIQVILLWQIYRSINNATFNVVEVSVLLFFSHLISFLCAFWTYRMIVNRNIA